MSIKNYLPYFNLIILIALAVYVLYLAQSGKGKSAFILNQEVFNHFKGKQDLENKLNVLRTKNKATSDSLIHLINTSRDQRLIDSYKLSLQNMEITEEQLSSAYTADIWKRINEYIKAYGDEHGYDFIYGASGDGGLMYASEDNNITKDVVKYINGKYEGN